MIGTDKTKLKLDDWYVACLKCFLASTFKGDNNRNVVPSLLFTDDPCVCRRREVVAKLSDN